MVCILRLLSRLLPARDFTSQYEIVSIVLVIDIHIDIIVMGVASHFDICLLTVFGMAISLALHRDCHSYGRSHTLIVVAGRQFS